MTVPATHRVARVAVVIVFIVAAFAIDQLTKAWAMSFLGDGRVVELGLGARLELVFNPGIAFGLGANLGAPLVVALIAVAGALVAWTILRAVTGTGKLTGTLFLAIAAGGAIGNIWDRISRAADGPLSGEVVDFIAVDWFAIFNVADIFTTCGIAAWALTLLLHRPHPEPATTDPADRREPEENLS
ncbi:MAG: signal peptidase II [Microbacteriaceae bacterium]|jgi:signal peptidase II|nr:signal peptidase II [Microbacteriaceae bacterium]